MAKYRSAIMDEIRQLLLDEVGSEQDFEDEQIGIQIENVLVEISDYSPYEDKDTVATTASSLEIDISDIENLLDVEKVEYPVGSNPPDYRNCSRFGNTLRFEYDGTPDGSNIYLYCLKVHELTDASTTLNRMQERILVLGGVAYLALDWINNIRPRIEQAVSDLTSGRSLINQVNYAGNPEGDYARYASSELSIASNLISTYQSWGREKLALYKQELRSIKRPVTKQKYPTG
ncbi:MAG: hypothetical protein A2158_00090 [Chloroflexi bacterium RBG_13_46_14]|nr:MAG: hypothetical protein A2158_00090 [Chloroflexi bacterium RBG_13_46_14]